MTKKYYEKKAFAIGKTIHLNGFRFQINYCEEYTHKHMEDNCEVFPQAPINAILAKIRESSLVVSISSGIYDPFNAEVG